MLERLVRDKRYPVVFNDVTGEYQLESIDGRWRHEIYHCLWCGGCLPSKRHTLFTEPDPAEQADVVGLISQAKTLAEVVKALGDPDRSTNCSAMEVPEPYALNAASGKRERSIHEYTARWKTLNVVVREFDDGSVDWVIAGKFKGLPAAPKRRLSWWWPWRRE
jgi:hypothetical protein